LADLNENGPDGLPRTRVSMTSRPGAQSPQESSAGSTDAAQGVRRRSPARTATVPDREARVEVLRLDGASVAIIAALTVAAFALRFWHLGAWGFDSDETFTLRDSLSPQFSNPRPLLYILNYFVVRPLVPLDEFGLRLLPAIFGGLAIPVFYLTGRRLIGNRSALLGTLLLTLSPLHIYYSQFARYWSLVFLLSAIYPYAIYRGLRERRRGPVILGLVAGMIAALAHPASVLLVGGLGLWFALTYLQGKDLRQLWSRRVVRWGVPFTALLVLVIVGRFMPMLQNWIVMHDGGNQTEFLLHLPGKPGVKQLAYLLSYVESLTLPLVLCGLLGIGFLWQGRDRSLALLLTCILAFPVAFLTLISFRTPVSTFYLVPPIPALFFGAGVLLDRLINLDGGLRPRWLLPATMTIIIVAAGAPTLVSQYRDGRRYDYRRVAQWLNGKIMPGDAVVSDQPKVLIHYLPNVEVQYLRGDATRLEKTLQGLSGAAPGAALWIVSPAPAHAFRTNPKIDLLREWLYEHCQLRNTVGVGRIDFRQYYLEVYRCPTSTPQARATTTHSE
jgi:mannosyltransferase